MSYSCLDLVFISSHACKCILFCVADRETEKYQQISQDFHMILTKINQKVIRKNTFALVCGQNVTFISVF